MTVDDSIVDVRKADAFEAGHIMGSVSVPTDGSKIEAGSEAAKALDEEFDYAYGGGLRMVLICYGGNTYAKAAMDYLYSAHPGIDKSDVTYLIGGANGYIGQMVTD